MPSISESKKVVRPDDEKFATSENGRDVPEAVAAHREKIAASDAATPDPRSKPKAVFDDQGDDPFDNLPV